MKRFKAIAYQTSKLAKKVEYAKEKKSWLNQFFLYGCLGLGVSLAIPDGALAAQSFPVDGYDVCRKISRRSQHNGNICSDVVARARFVDGYGAAICAAIIDRRGSSSDALKCMQNIANKRIQRSAADVCIALAKTGRSSFNAAKCAYVIAGKTIDDRAARYCEDMVYRRASTSEVVSCMASKMRPGHGRPPGGDRACLRTELLLDQIRDAQHEIDRRDTSRAWRILNRLGNRLEECVDRRPGHRPPTHRPPTRPRPVITKPVIKPRPRPGQIGSRKSEPRRRR